MRNYVTLFTVSLSLIFIITTFSVAQDNSLFGNKDFSNDSLFRKKTNTNKKDSVFKNDFSKKSSKYKVIAISAVFNAQKPRLAQTKQEINNFYDFCVKNKIPPFQVVTIIPPYTTGLDHELGKLMMIGADVSFTLPGYLSKIKHVPSYVAFTQEGYYILDGIRNVDSIVNTTGHLIKGR